MPVEVKKECAAAAVHNTTVKQTTTMTMVTEVEVTRAPSPPGSPQPAAIDVVSKLDENTDSTTTDSTLATTKPAVLFTLELEQTNQEERTQRLERRLTASPISQSDHSSSVRTLSISAGSPLATTTTNLAAEPIKKIPNSDPESPAYMALVKANEKTDRTLRDKRVRIGKSKLGRAKYHGDRSFKKPAGNEIDGQHEQYALTYGMMCGILNSAGLQNPFKQRLTMDDFMRVDKRDFPASSKLQHPFKFKDYSPDIFRQIRRRFCIDSADYMVTLCGDFNYIEFMSNSKSGQFFFYSHDGRFMIKTQTKDESKFLRRILPHYYKFVMENPNTLITRFYGMHRVKMHHLRRKMHFIIMASVFDTPLEIHGRFDLKGSKIGRRATPKERSSNGVLKDMDLVESGFQLQMGPERRAMLLVQLRKDVEFLKRMKIMDYSLLIGIHDSRQAIHTSIYGPTATNTGNIPTEPATSRSLPSSPTPGDSSGNGELRHSFGNDMSATPVRMGRSVSLPPEPVSLAATTADAAASERQAVDVEDVNIMFSPNVDSPSSWVSSDYGMQGDESGSESDSNSSDGEGDFAVDGAAPPFMQVNGKLVIDTISPRTLDVEHYPGHSESVFCRDEGGVYGRDRNGRKNGYVYFLGVIDILQQYNSRKIAETFFKGFRHNRKQISSVNPNFYGDRFIEFMEKHVVMDETLPIRQQQQHRTQFPMNV